MPGDSLSIQFSDEYTGNYTDFIAVVLITETPGGGLPKFLAAYSTTKEGGAWINFQKSKDSYGTEYLARNVSSLPENCPIITEVVGDGGLTPTISVAWPDISDGSGGDIAAFSGFDIGDSWNTTYGITDFDAYMISSVHHERTTDLIYTDATDGSIKFFNLDGEPNEAGQYTEVVIEEVSNFEGATPSIPTDMDVYDKNIFIGYGPQAPPMKTKYTRTPGGKGVYNLEELEIRAPKTSNSPEQSVDKVVDTALLWNTESMMVGMSIGSNKLYAISKESSQILITDDIPFEIASICSAWDDDWETNTTGSDNYIYAASYKSMRIVKVKLTITADVFEAIVVQDINIAPKYPTADANFPTGASIGDIVAYRQADQADWASTVFIEQDVILAISGFKEIGFGEGETQVVTGSVRDMEINNTLGGLFHTLEYSDRSIPNNKCSKIRPGHFKSYHWWGEVKSNDRHSLYYDSTRIKFRDAKDRDGAFYNYLDLTTKQMNDDGSYNGQTAKVTINAYSSWQDFWASALGGLLEYVLDGLAFAWLLAGGWLILSAGLTLTSVVATAIPVLARFGMGYGVAGTLGKTTLLAGPIINGYIANLSSPQAGADTYFPLGFDTGWRAGVSIYLPRLGMTIINDLDATNDNLWEPYIGVIAHSDTDWVKYGGCAQYQDDYSGLSDVHAIASKANGNLVKVDSFLYTFSNLEWSEDYFAGSGMLAISGYALDYLIKLGPDGIVYNETSQRYEVSSGNTNPVSTYWGHMTALSKLSPQYDPWDGTPKKSLSKAIFPISVDISQEEIVHCAVVDAAFSSITGTLISEQVAAIETADPDPTAGDNIVITNDAICDTLKLAIVTNDDTNDAAELYILNLVNNPSLNKIRSEFTTKFTRISMESASVAIKPESIQNMISNFDSAAASAQTGPHYNIERPLLFPLIGSTNTIGIFSTQRLGYHVYTPSVSTSEDFVPNNPLASYPISGVWGQTEYTTFDAGTEVVSGGYFLDGEEYRYKIAYLYDNSYISPLGKGAWHYTPATATTGNSLDHLRCTIVINKPDTRVTHVLLYRKDPSASAYAEAASIKISRFIEIAATGGGSAQLMAQLVDDGDVLGTFAGDTGISETMHRPMVYFEQSAVLGGRIYAVNISSPGNPHDDMSHVICMSKSNNFHIFDWANDMAILPNIPAAIAAFNGRIYVWDDVNTYRINPDTLFIEDTYEGVGCFGRNAFVVTEYGMCFADKNNIYLHSGGDPKAIGAPILTSLESSDFIGWQELDKKGIKVGYDATINAFVIFVSYQTGISTTPIVTIEEVTLYNWIATHYHQMSLPSWDIASTPDLSGDIVAGDGVYLLNTAPAQLGTVRGSSGVGIATNATVNTDPNNDLLSMTFTDSLGTVITPKKISWNDVSLVLEVVFAATDVSGLEGAGVIPSFTGGTLLYEYNDSDTQAPTAEGIAYSTTTSMETVTTYPPIIKEGTFIFNRLSGSWTFSDRNDAEGNDAPLSTIAQGPTGEIYMAEPTAIKVFAKGAGIKKWSWTSKEFDFDAANINKKFSKIYIRGTSLNTSQESFQVLVDGASVSFDIKVKNNVIELGRFNPKKGMTIQVKLVNQSGSLEAVSFSGKPKRVK